MIVLGADMHKSSHTLAAVAAATGEMLDEKTAAVGARGFDVVLRWARALGPERVWVSRPGFGGDLEARMMSWQRGILRTYGTSEEVPRRG